MSKAWDAGGTECVDESLAAGNEAQLLLYGQWLNSLEMPTHLVNCFYTVFFGIKYKTEEAINVSQPIYFPCRVTALLIAETVGWIGYEFICIFSQI